MRSFILAITFAAGAHLIGACTTSVVDSDGGTSDIADGGDVSLLHPAGSFCKSWTPSEVTPPPACKNDADPACDAWMQSSTPPSFPAIAQCDHIQHVCIATQGYGTVNCNLGKAGDDYCTAWAEAWLQPATPHGLCLSGGEAPASCSFLPCDPKDPSGQNASAKHCDPSQVCVVHVGGELSCELPCSGP